MTTGKTIALNGQTFVGKVMSLLFNMLSRLVIGFLPRSKRLLISWLQSPSAVIIEPRKIKSATVSTVSPSICHEVMEPDDMILVFWLLSFKPIFSPRWWSRGMCAHLLLRELQNYNLLLNNRQQENVGSHQKKRPHVQGQRKSPSKMVGGAKSCLESNPIPTRDSWRAQTNLVCTRTQIPCRDWARPVCECLLWRYGSVGQQWTATGAGALGAVDLCGIRSLGRGRH